jgi:hypothetical protein
VSNELLALFRDDMLNIGSVPANEYYLKPDFPPDTEVDLSYRDKDAEVIIAVYSCPGSVAADRLDLLGATIESSFKFFDDRLAERAFTTKIQRMGATGSERLLPLQKDGMSTVSRSQGASNICWIWWRLQMN